MSKNLKCLKILKAYGVLVDFEGAPKDGPGKGKTADETFGKWKRRVLGKDVENVLVYIPVEVPPQTRMRSLKERGGASHVVGVVSELTRLKEIELDTSLSETERDLVEQYSTIPKRTLLDVVDELGEDLEPSVREFFQRFLEGTDRRTGAKELLQELTSAYNSAVKSYRKAVNLP